jgi:hypothetical protein
LSNGILGIPVSLSDIISEINSLRSDRALMRKLGAADRAIDEHWRKGLNPEVIALAETVLSVRGNYERAGGESAGAVRDAITDLADNGGARLADRTFGVKDYDRWTGQRCDCSYGCGPRHGSVTFDIGLNEEVRRRVREGAGLTEDETEAAIYYLANLKEIQGSRRAALAAAGGDA